MNLFGWNSSHVLLTICWILWTTSWYRLSFELLKMPDFFLMSWYKIIYLVRVLKDNFLKLFRLSYRLTVRRFACKIRCLTLGSFNLSIWLTMDRSLRYIPLPIIDHIQSLYTMNAFPLYPPSFIWQFSFRWWILCRHLCGINRCESSISIWENASSLN